MTLPTSALDAALRYAAIGWPIFPCGADKKPLIDDWPNAGTCDQDQLVGWWRRWPHAHVAVVCGRAGITVVDLDLGNGKDGIVAFAAALGSDPHGCGLVASTPRAGRHLVYLAGDPPLRNGVDVLGPGSGVDIRGDGGYVVLPSPVSPGREWVEGDPFGADRSTGASDLLPMPAHVLEILQAGHHVGQHGPRSTSPGVDSSVRMPLDDRQVAEIREALDWIDNTPREPWIKVGMALKSTSAGEQALDLWMDWARIDRTNPAGTHPKFDEKVHRKQWKSISEYRPDGSEITIATLFHLAREAGYQMSGAAELALELGATNGHADHVADPRKPATPKGRLFPPQLLSSAGGVLGDLAQWILEASPRRQPALCLGAAIATMGALVGRRVETSTGLRTNFLVLGVGETGAGKDSALKCPPHALALAGLDRWIGPGGWKSDSGLRAALVREPSHCCYVDEFTLTLKMLSGDRVPPHLAGIKHALMRYYSNAAHTNAAEGYADSDRKAPPAIQQPNLCVYAVGTPVGLAESLSSSEFRNGFLNRWLVMFSDDALPPRQEGMSREPPAELLARLQALEARTRPESGELTGATNDLATGTGCRTIQMAPEAADYARGMQQRADDRVRAMRADRDKLADLWIRHWENAIKLALLRCACDRDSRLVSLADVTWGDELATWCVERVHEMAADHVADNQTESQTKAVLALIDRAGEQGLSLTGLTRATQWLQRGQRKDILATLVDSHQIASVPVTRSNGSNTRGPLPSVFRSSRWGGA